VWRGREKLHYLNAEPINAIADRWISQYDRARVRALADLKTALSYTWHSFTPELAERFGWTAEFLARIAGEPRSTVTFEIEPAGDAVVKLTVIHDGFGPGSTVADMVSGGWPAVVASLKTLLETGDPLPLPA
jgi:Activator of Hsp90 ATPase homolog 1-like protein